MPWELEWLQAVGEYYISENMKLVRTIALFFPMMAMVCFVFLSSFISSSRSQTFPSTLTLVNPSFLNLSRRVIGTCI